LLKKTSPRDLINDLAVDGIALLGIEWLDPVTPWSVCEFSTTAYAV